MPQPTGRPTPPGINTGSRPTPPGSGTSNRPTPPGVIATPTLGDDAMRWLTRQVDRDRNGSLDEGDARVVGQVGNRNGVNGTAETADALNQGKAAIYGFQLAGDLADTLANWFSKGDAWVSKDDTEITEAAKARLDGNRDGRVSRAELAEGLNRGGLALNARGIMTSDEAKSRFAPAPIRPPSIDTPRPPSIGGTRPPSIDTPRPPSIDTPRPPSFDRGVEPGEILSGFMRRHNELKAAYNGTSMSRATYDEASRRITGEALDALVNDTRHASYPARKSVLDAIYQASSMNSTERDAATTRLWNQAVGDLLASRPSYAEGKLRLEAIYQASNMNSTQRNEIDAQLIGIEVERIKRSGDSFTTKMARLQALYNGSSMSRTEFQRHSDELTRNAF